jgi:hypothetical protein
MMEKTEPVQDEGYCDETDRPLPEPPCGLELPCPVHDVTEPTRFAWFRDGLLVAGTLTDWAKMWEGDYYAGEDDLSRVLWTAENADADMAKHHVSVEWGKKSEEHYTPVTMTVPGFHDTVIVSVDMLS